MAAEKQQTDMNRLIQDFERGRVQLGAIEAQSQQLTVQGQVLGEALKELKATKEKKVFKAVGNILILTDVKKVEKDLKDQKESADLRAKTVKRQEDAMLDKLNKLKVEIESAQKGKSAPEAGSEKSGDAE